MANVDFDSLSLLLNLSSKNEFELILSEAFENKDRIRIPDNCVQSLKRRLQVDSDKSVEKLFRSLTIIINLCLTLKEANHASIAALFPDTVNEKLRNTIVAILASRLEEWNKQRSVISSMPSLNDFQLKTGNGPKCELNLTLNDSGEKNTANIIIERHKLADIIEGMSRIRRQLFTAAESR